MKFLTKLLTILALNLFVIIGLITGIQMTTENKDLKTIVKEDISEFNNGMKDAIVLVRDELVLILNKY